MMEPLIAYLHYLSILLTAGFLVAELVTCRPGMTGERARRLAAIDVVFFVSALAALATGLLDQADAHVRPLEARGGERRRAGG
jgi:putative membrane protein